MRLLAALLITTSAFAQGGAWTASTSGSTTAAGEINNKANWQTGSGAPSGLNCTVGKDVYTDTATGNLYKCTTTGTPGSWTLVGISGLTTNKIPKAASGTTIGDSSLTDDGTTVSTTEPITAASFSSGGTPPTITGGTAGAAALAAGTATTATTGFGFQGPATSGTPYLMTLPNAPATGFVFNTGTSHPSALSFVAAGTGVATWMTTPSSANLRAALTDESGTGVALFAGTPQSNITARYWSCQTGMGDGVNAMTSATYLQTFCYNDTGSTITISGIKCYADAGTPTLSATNGAGTALLTGAITCTTSFAAGTQSGTTTIASGDFIKFSFAAGGTAKQTTWVVTGSY